MICDMCCINCIKRVLFLKMDGHSSGDSGHRESLHSKKIQRKILPCSSKIIFSVWLKVYSIYFSLWLLDVEEENIHLCIKNRYQGVFSAVRDVYIVFWYIVEKHKLCASVFEICQWCGVKSAIRSWRQTSCTRFL